MRGLDVTPARSLLLLALLAVGCGSNDAAVPQGLLDAIRAGARPADGGTSTYPAGPYGTQVGDVTRDLCFQGWEDPKAANYDITHFQPICLSNFHADPDARLLLVESCAVWCVSCRSEYGGDGATQPSLTARLAALQGQGFRILGTIFQDAAAKPATPADAATWAEVYSLDFPFALDAEHQLGLFTSTVTAPFNLLIDTKTMKIVLALSGNEPSVLFGAVDTFLAGTGP